MRQAAGLAQGLSDAASICANLTEGETIKIVTHSMGTGFGRGYARGIKQYAKEHGLGKISIEYELDASSFNGKKLPTQDDVVERTDAIMGGKDGFKIGGLLKYGITGSVPTVSIPPGATNVTSTSG